MGHHSLPCLCASLTRFSPVLCGFHLSRFTCFTRCKGFCLVVVFLVFLVCFVCVFWFGLFVCLPVFGCLFPDSLCFFACLSSFTDWCTAHRQQFREQKNEVTSPPMCKRGVLTPYPISSFVVIQRQKQKRQPVAHIEC